MKRKNGFSSAIIAAVFLLISAQLFAEVNTVAITSMVPPNPGLGDTVAINFSYCVNAYEESRLMLAVSTASTFQANNTAGQTFLVSESGINNPVASVNGGYNMGDNQSVNHCETGTWNITIPSTLNEGATYYIVLGGRAYYTAPGQVASQNYISFTTPPPATGCSITKTAEMSSVTPGDYVLYTINYNYANANTPQITDTVPLYCTLISQSAGGTNGGTAAGSGLTWAFASTATRKIGQVWFIVQVNSGAPLSTPISNVAGWSLIDPGTLGTLTGTSNDAVITTAGPPVYIKSQNPASPATAAIGDTVTYTLDFHAGGETFSSYDTFDTNVSGFTAVSGGGTANPGTWTWINGGGGEGYLYSARQGAGSFPRYLKSAVSDFCYGEIQADLYIEANGYEDSLISFKDNGVADAGARAYGVGLSADHNPGEMYLQKSQPYTLLTTASPFSTQAGTWYTVKIRVTDGGVVLGTHIQARAWLRGTTEPGIWHIDYYDASGSQPGCGYVGFQGHPDNYNYYDNLKILKSKPTSPVVYDTIPSIITYLGGTAGDTTHGDPVISGGMVSWNVFTSLTDAAYTLQWWGVINFCGDVYNKFSFNSKEFPVVDSNSTTLNVPVCPQSPTITPTWTNTSTPIPSATFTPTFTVTVTPTFTVTMTPVYYPTLVLVKSSDVNPADPGSTVNYTISYTNTGVIAATNVSIIDLLNNNLTYVTGSSVPAPNSAPPPGTNGGTIDWIIPSIAPYGGTGSITFAAIVAPGVVKGTVITNQVSSTCLQSSTPVLSNQHSLNLNIPDLRLTPVVSVPNPAVDYAEIIFNLTVSADVTMKFYTISGELIRVMEPAEVTANLMHGQLYTRAGNNSMYWDCKNKAGQKVASGVYFYRVQAETAAGEKAFYISKLAVLR